MLQPVRDERDDWFDVHETIRFASQESVALIATFVGAPKTICAYCFISKKAKAEAGAQPVFEAVAYGVN